MKSSENNNKQLNISIDDLIPISLLDLV